MDAEPEGYGSIPQVEEGSSSTDDAATVYSLRAKLIAELIGTTILVQVGTGANCIGLYVDGTQGMWQIAVIWILAATIGIFASGKISGGHLNPAVTLSFAVVRPTDFALANVVPYWAAQVLGAMLGAMINLTIFYRAAIEFEESVGVKRGSAASIQSAEALSDYWSLSDFVDNSLHAFFLEAFGTAFLVFVIFMITNTANNVPSGAVPILVGIAIGSMVNILGPLTNAGINPARDLGPRLVMSVAGWGMAAFTNWWVYLLAPLVGGPIGALVADKVLME